MNRKTLRRLCRSSLKQVVAVRTNRSAFDVAINIEDGCWFFLNEWFDCGVRVLMSMIRMAKCVELDCEEKERENKRKRLSLSLFFINFTT